VSRLKRQCSSTSKTPRGISRCLGAEGHGGTHGDLNFRWSDARGAVREAEIRTLRIDRPGLKVRLTSFQISGPASVVDPVLAEINKLIGGG
jgi:hypothetical protein